MSRGRLDEFLTSATDTCILFPFLLHHLPTTQDLYIYAISPSGPILVLDYQTAFENQCSSTLIMKAHYTLRTISTLQRHAGRLQLAKHGLMPAVLRPAWTRFPTERYTSQTLL